MQSTFLLCITFGFVYNGIIIIDIVNVARSFMFFNFDAQIF